MEARIVTLTTDWGERDFFAAMVKGRLCSLIPGVNIYDLSHRQTWNDTVATVGIIRHGCFSFPKGSVHIVDTGFLHTHAENNYHKETPLPVVALCKGHYFICTDRTILEMSLEEQCEELAQIEIPQSLVTAGFLVYTHCCDVVRQIFEGMKPNQIGSPCQPLNLFNPLGAQMENGNVLVTMVTGIDNYGNVNLNVSYQEFEAYRADRTFRTVIEWTTDNHERYEIDDVKQHYNNVFMGELILTVSATGALQLAINKGSAAQLLGLKNYSRCRFIFS